MTDLTRRTVLAGAAAAAAAPLAATSSADAAAPPAGKQVPSYYRYKVGDYELTAILDGVRQVKLDVSPIRNAKLEDVQAVLAASYLPKDQVGYYFHPTVVNTGSKLVLIDTGNGPGSIQTGTGHDPRQSRRRRHRSEDASTSSSSRISTATTSAGCAPPTARSPIPMPRSRCRRRNGRTGPTRATPAARRRASSRPSRTPSASSVRSPTR